MTLADPGRADEHQRQPLSPDARRLVAAQALRAFTYGFAALLLGSTLRRRGLSPSQAGLVLGAVVAGTIAASLAVTRWSDRLGRRRCYAALYGLLGAAGAVFALSDRVVLLVVVALTGVLSTDIVDNGPFTSLEQVMLATELADRERIRGFGLYNAVAAARTHTLPALYWAASQLHLPTLAGAGYHGPGAGIHTPIKKPAGSAYHALHLDNRAYNQLLRGVRALGERAAAELTGRWRTLGLITLSPSRIGDIARAALALNNIWK